MTTDTTHAGVTDAPSRTRGVRARGARAGRERDRVRGGATMTPLLQQWLLDHLLTGRVHHMEALELLSLLPDASVDLISTDPPFNVDKAAWDSWETVEAFIAWLDGHLREMRRVLKPNGSLYLFCATKYAADVEIAVRKHFNVLNTIRWKKPPFSTKAEMFDKEAMRAYFPASESIVFAEQYGADSPYQGALIDGNATYWGALESAKVSIIGDYLKSEFQRAGATNREIAALFPSRTGGLTGCVSNWLLGLNVPTPEQYQKMRDYLNRNGEYSYLRREYEDLRREYEDLRREYEDLRREYEDLRRPFYATPNSPYTDVWEFPTVNTYPGKHVCEKPLSMAEHIVRVSSRPGALVLDPFAGSGNLLRGAFLHGRRYIGGDADAYWARVADTRVKLPFNLSLVDALEQAA